MKPTRHLKWIIGWIIATIVCAAVPIFLTLWWWSTDWSNVEARVVFLCTIPAFVVSIMGLLRELSWTDKDYERWEASERMRHEVYTAVLATLEKELKNLTKLQSGREMGGSELKAVGETSFELIRRAVERLEGDRRFREIRGILNEIERVQVMQDLRNRDTSKIIPLLESLIRSLHRHRPVVAA